MTAMATRSVTVQVDGRPVAPDARLVSVRVAAKLNQPTQCELAYATPPVPSAVAALGAGLRVGLGGQSEALFTGEVTAIEYETGPDGVTTIRVRAYDPLHRLRKHQQLRVFESVTAADLAGQLAEPVGLSVRAESDGPRLERVLQHRHTDLELLLEVCGRAGLHLAMDSDDLRLVALDGYGQPVSLDVGRNLWQVTISANLDGIAASSDALGWHPQKAEPLSGSTDNARSGRQARQELDGAAVGAGGARTLVDQPGRSEDEVTALAQAAYDIRVASALTVDGTAEGDTALKVGGRIAVGGVAEQVAGVYVLTEVTHTIDAASHLTTFSTRPPAAPTPAPGASATLGTVTDVDDPDRLGRVRVNLPALGDLDAGWLAVVCPGAGQGRGIVALPDVDDTVLVLLPHGEPTAGLVLGSLFGTIGPPDSAGIDSGRVKRWSLITAEGQSIVVDNGGRKLRLANDVGSYLELTPDKLTLHAATDLVLEAPGRAMTVRAANIDFQHAPGSE
jgi:phage protein D/phage baseplate assembly protein gpV